jgi:hypothetical protein
MRAYGWNWPQVRQIPFVAIGNELQLVVPRSLLGFNNINSVRINLKWVNNMIRHGDILSLVHRTETLRLMVDSAMFIDAHRSYGILNQINKKITFWAHFCAFDFYIFLLYILHMIIFSPVLCTW